MVARLVALSLVVLPAFAFAEEDLSKMYDLTIEATPKLKQGAEGRVSVRITPRGGAEIHKEAPISLALDAKGVTPDKAKVGREALRMDGQNAAFDVAFKGEAAGAGKVDATLKFYICTEKLCASQERKASLPVTVEPR